MHSISTKTIYENVWFWYCIYCQEISHAVALDELFMIVGTEAVHLNCSMNQLDHLWSAPPFNLSLLFLRILYSLLIIIYWSSSLEAPLFSSKIYSHRKCILCNAWSLVSNKYLCLEWPVSLRLETDFCWSKHTIGYCFCWWILLMMSKSWLQFPKSLAKRQWIPLFKFLLLKLYWNSNVSICN